MIEAIYINNDNLLTIDQVKDSSDDSFINDATVTCTFTDKAGTNVAGQSWPLTMSYVSGSSGKYQGVLEESLSLTKDKKYIAIISIDAGADLIAEFRKEFVARYRN